MPTTAGRGQRFTGQPLPPLCVLGCTEADLNPRPRERGDTRLLPLVAAGTSEDRSADIKALPFAKFSVSGPVFFF